MQTPTIVAVGGGKGGVGKSLFTANVGLAMAQAGKRVGFVDADLDGANLHTVLGIARPKSGLSDFLCGSASQLSDVALALPEQGSWLISGASDVLQLANPAYLQKRKIIQNVQKLNADVIMIDLGAGSSNNICDFFISFSHGIVVLDNLPTSIENSYGFLKNAVLRGFIRLFPGDNWVQSKVKNFSLSSLSQDGPATVERFIAGIESTQPQVARRMRNWLAGLKIYLVLNMVMSRGDIGVVERYRSMVQRYLSVHPLFIGFIPFDEGVRFSVKRRNPVMRNGNPAQVKEAIELIGHNLMAVCS